MLASIRVLALLLLCLIAPAASAQVRRFQVALDIQSKTTHGAEAMASRSVARRVTALVVPALQDKGFDVVRVADWTRAIKSGRHDAVIRLNVDARALTLVPSADLYLKDQAPMNGPKPRHYRDRSLQVNSSHGVEAWAAWTTWDGKGGEHAGKGSIPRMASRVEGSGDSARLEDEDNIARLLSDAIVKAVIPSIDYATTPVARTN